MGRILNPPGFELTTSGDQGRRLDPYTTGATGYKVIYYQIFWCARRSRVNISVILYRISWTRVKTSGPKVFFAKNKSVYDWFDTHNILPKIEYIQLVIHCHNTTASSQIIASSKKVSWTWRDFFPLFFFTPRTAGVYWGSSSPHRFKLFFFQTTQNALRSQRDVLWCFFWDPVLLRIAFFGRWNSAGEQRMPTADRIQRGEETPANYIHIISRDKYYF